MNAPNTFTPSQIRELNTSTDMGDGRYIPARPYGWQGLALRLRMRAAWLVFTGRADVLRWEGGQ